MDVDAVWCVLRDASLFFASGVFATLPLAVVVGLVVWLGRSWLAPWARHALWTVVLLRLIVPSAIESPVSVQQLVPWRRFVEPSSSLTSLPAFPTFLAPTASRDLPDPLPVAAAPVPQPAPTPAGEVLAQPTPTPHIEAPSDGFQGDEQDWLALALLCGSAVVVVWSVVTSRRWQRRLQQATVHRDDEALALLDAGRAQFGVSAPVTMLVVPGLTGAATIGWLRPTILLPEDAATLSRDELQHVLWHELAHIRRGDGLLCWLPAIVRVFHWWNPLFWCVHQLWLAERELACDAMAVERLGNAAASDYGKTLIRFMERRLQSGSDDVACSPAFASFVGAKAAFTRRLRAIARGPRPAGRWSATIAGCAVAFTAVAGLTDAAPPTARPEEPTSFALPDGAVWHTEPGVSPEEAKANEPVEAEYDLAPLIARMRADAPLLTLEGAAEEVANSLARATPMGLSPFPPAAGMSVGDVSLSSLSWRRLHGERLKLMAPPTTHAHLRQLLQRWTDAGQRVVKTELVFLTTPLELRELLPTGQGEIFSPGRSPSVSDFTAPVAPASVSASAMQDVMQPSVPMYVRVLRADERRSLLQAIQTNARSMIISAPQVASVEGQMASVQIGQATPFIGGYSQHADGVKPNVLLQEAGVRMHFTAWSRSDSRIHVRLQVHHSQTSKLETLRIASSGGPVEMHIPHVLESRIDASAAVADDQTLLIAPLRPDEEGRLLIVLTKSQTMEEPMGR